MFKATYTFKTVSLLQFLHIAITDALLPWEIRLENIIYSLFSLWQCFSLAPWAFCYVLLKRHVSKERLDLLGRLNSPSPTPNFAIVCLVWSLPRLELARLRSEALRTETEGKSRAERGTCCQR